MSLSDKSGMMIGNTEKGASSTDTPVEDFALGECDEILDARADRKLTTRLDIKVMPILGLLYLIVFLDRTAIGSVSLCSSCLYMSNG
jgi:predicted nucleic acid-binding Zn ribbon protein